MNLIKDSIVKLVVNNDNRVDYPIFFQQEASDIAILIYRCHWYIWVYLTFILVFVLCMFFFIILDASKVRYVSSIEDLYFRHLYLKWSKVEHMSRIEFIWTVLPCVFLMLMGIRSIATLYLIDAPLNVFAVLKAYGRQWYWQFEVSEARTNLWLNEHDPWGFYGMDVVSILKVLGIESINARDVRYIEISIGTVSFFDSYMSNLDDSDEEKYSFGEGDLIRTLSVDVPVSVYVGLPLRFMTTAMDVLHSFAVPSLGIKMDAVPGRLNSCDIVIEREGLFYGQCSELCGQGHGFMPVCLYSSVPTGLSENDVEHEKHLERELEDIFTRTNEELFDIVMIYLKDHKTDEELFKFIGNYFVDNEEAYKNDDEVDRLDRILVNKIVQHIQNKRL